MSREQIARLRSVFGSSLLTLHYVKFGLGYVRFTLGYHMTVTFCGKFSENTWMILCLFCERHPDLSATIQGLLGIVIAGGLQRLLTSHRKVIVKNNNSVHNITESKKKMRCILETVSKLNMERWCKDRCGPCLLGTSRGSELLQKVLGLHMTTWPEHMLEIRRYKTNRKR